MRKMKKYEKMISIFEFSTSKLSYVEVFMKIREKCFDPSFKTFFFSILQIYKDSQLNNTKI